MQLYESIEVALYKNEDEEEYEDEIPELLKKGYEPFFAFPVVRDNGKTSWVDHYFYFRKPINRKGKLK